MEERLTAGELVAQAHAAGHETSERLVKDWVRKGLLDRASERGRGYGRGFDRSWPPEQRDLFLVLLERRAAGAGVRLLANVPVARWLLGEGIPTRQVRRALSTWAMPSGVPSIKAARTVARDLTRWMRLSRTRTEGFDRLLDLLAGAIYEDSQAGENFIQTVLRGAIVRELLPRVLSDERAYTEGRVVIGATPDFNAHLLETELTALGSIGRARALDRRGSPHDPYLDWLDVRLEQARLVAYLNIVASPARTEGATIEIDQQAVLRLLPTLGMELHHPADPR